MGMLRQFPGYVLAAVIAGIGVAMMMIAWVGWVEGVNWYWALGALLLSLFARFNLYVIVGAYFFATDYMNWQMLQSSAFAMIGLMYLTPTIMRDLGLMLTGRDATGQT